MLSKVFNIALNFQLFVASIADINHKKTVDFKFKDDATQKD